MTSEHRGGQSRSRRYLPIAVSAVLAIALNTLLAQFTDLGLLGRIGVAAAVFLAVTLMLRLSGVGPQSGAARRAPPLPPMAPTAPLQPDRLDSSSGDTTQSTSDVSEPRMPRQGLHGSG